MPWTRLLWDHQGNTDLLYKPAYVTRTIVTTIAISGCIVSRPVCLKLLNLAVSHTLNWSISIQINCSKKQLLRERLRTCKFTSAAVELCNAISACCTRSAAFGRCSFAACDLLGAKLSTRRPGLIFRKNQKQNWMYLTCIATLCNTSHQHVMACHITLL